MQAFYICLTRRCEVELQVVRRTTLKVRLAWAKKDNLKCKKRMQKS